MLFKKIFVTGLKKIFDRIEFQYWNIRLKSFLSFFLFFFIKVDHIKKKIYHCVRFYVSCIRKFSTKKEKPSRVWKKFIETNRIIGASNNLPLKRIGIFWYFISHVKFIRVIFFLFYLKFNCRNQTTFKDYTSFFRKMIYFFLMKKLMNNNFSKK